MTVLSIPAELGSACAHMTPAGPADAVAGIRARFVAAPASTAEAAELLRAAAGLGLTVVARGGGNRLDWAPAPASCDLIVDTGRLDKILEHTAGDLVVSVQAGVRLDDLAAVLAAAGQRLALDPPGNSGTIGGLIATGAAGPLRFRYGSPRDLLIGITVIRADGTIAKAGGKVVKNVAGYDIGKLFAGSYGTLGLITEATFRLHPLPESTAWVTLDCPDPASAAAAVQAIADSPLAPAAIELDWPRASAQLSVAALLEGDEPSVALRADRLAELLERAVPGQSPVHTKRTGDRPAHRTPADSGAKPSPDSTPDDRAGADAGAADEAFRVLRPPSSGRGTEEPGPESGHDGAGADAGAAVGPFRVVRPLAGGRGGPATLLRVSFWAGKLVDVLGAIRGAAGQHGLDPAVGGSAGAAVLEVAVGAEAAADAVAGFVADLRASLGALGGGSVVPATA
ncbi:MAG TPA: FAD-binding oxidoreductase, partial [Streptosporangiaceae bacterium]|nr:FAD-binding oxidoreductase [Streptosporangiaceae bacterium]